MCALWNEPSSPESIGRHREQVFKAVSIYVILFVTWFFIFQALHYLGLLVLMLPASEWWLMTAVLALVTERVIYRRR